MFYDTSDYPEEDRMTNPESLRGLARMLDRSANGLPQAEDLRRGTDITPDLDDGTSNVSWMLWQITNELAVSYSRETSQPLPHDGALNAAAISGCAAPLGTALKHLGFAADRLSSHHHVLRTQAAPIQVPEDLLVPLQRDISRARAAIRQAAKRLRENATLLQTAATSSLDVAGIVSPSVTPEAGQTG
ncbi:hypothetical protein [Streptomyces sp. CC53]|uniref:hypothetical protein n=1 Tax=Streptomyces sp. CC53 TaxID=1906740 RepID=UPI0015A60144|nr:hypothetical protein [Streptomyces sp. CC53]